MTINSILQSFLLTVLYIGTTATTIGAESTSSNVKLPSGIENSIIDKHQHIENTNSYAATDTEIKKDLSSKPDNPHHEHENKEIPSKIEQSPVTSAHSHDSNNNSLNADQLSRNDGYEKINQSSHKSQHHAH